ncbi:MAG: serine hydrolase [Sphingobium sp.]
MALLLLGIAAMAIDDGRFWLRYATRLPAIMGLADKGGANAIPDTRAVIAGRPGKALRRCAPSPAMAQALGRADAYLTARKTDAFLVWHDGCLVFEHYGKGDAGTPRAAGAMAKSLMAIVAGRMMQEGMLSGLDQPVATHVAEWRGDSRRAIRYRDLLGMHAGLAWYHQTSSPFGDFQRIIIGSDYAPRALALPRVARPGQLYDYSAWTYDVLGIALARAGGKPYEVLASDLVAKPLGLGDARIYVDRPGGTVHGNCCLFNRADDWVRLGAFLAGEIRRPTMLPAAYLKAMQRGYPDQPNYGLGLWLGTPFSPRREVASAHNPYPTPVRSVIDQSEPFAAPDVLTFEGVTQNKTWIVPSRDLVIVRLGGAPQDWDDALVPNLLLRSIG